MADTRYIAEIDVRVLDKDMERHQGGAVSAQPKKPRERLRERLRKAPH